VQYTDTTSRQLCMSAVRFVNGAVYDGEWNKGKKHGKGVFSYPDGSKYDGTNDPDARHSRVLLHKSA